LTALIKTCLAVESATSTVTEAAVYTEECESNSLGNIAGEQYRGTISKTKSGLECKKWTASQSFEISAATGVGDHNYCRNPDGDTDGAWCFTTDPDTRFDYCQCENSKLKPGENDVQDKYSH